jgi:hypothetical protein
VFSATGPYQLGGCTFNDCSFAFEGRRPQRFNS